MSWKKRLFLSHRSSDPSDRASANNIKKVLERLAADAVHVFVSGTDIRAGKDWRDAIGEELAKADYLVFLYTDPQANWNWCHFEAGLFLSPAYLEKNPDSREKIICIYPQTLDVSSSPLSNYQTIRVPDELESLKDFLLRLFVGGDPIRKLWYRDHQDKLDEMAREIAAEVQRMATDSVPLSCSISLRGKDMPELADIDGVQVARDIPGSYIVETDPKSLKDVFDHSGRRPDGNPWTWQDLRPPGSWQPWVSDLATTIATYIEKKQVPGRIRGRFKSPSGRIYDPVLTRIDRSGIDYSFQVLFLEHEHDNRTDPVSSFKDLMDRLVELIRSTTETDTIKFLAYTPALGFLAESEAHWDELYNAMLEKSEQIEMICLREDHLERWHGKFNGKKTARDSAVIDDMLITEANTISKDLIDRLDRAPKRRSFEELPGFYVFKNMKRAIVVAPVGVPLLGEPGAPEINRQSRETKVEMFGLDTNVSGIIRNAELAFARFNQS